MAIAVRGTLGTLKRSAKDFWADHCPRMAAALSYYTIFSLPPLLILLIMVAGLAMNPEEVQSAIEAQIGGLIGPQGAAQIREMISHAEQPGNDYKAILGLGALIFGATGAFIQLQTALKRCVEGGARSGEGGHPELHHQAGLLVRPGPRRQGHAVTRNPVGVPASVRTAVPRRRPVSVLNVKSARGVPVLTSGSKSSTWVFAAALE